nr:unnamed protein product [Callosobruchus analis]
MSQPARELNILQWNVLSLNKRKSDLIDLITKEKVDIIVLCEIWLKDDAAINLKGFNCIQKNRRDGKGGVAILIAKDLKFKNININPTFNQAIEVCAMFIEQLGLTIVSIYKPPNKSVSVEDWENFFSQFSGDTLFCGDFNCHHTLWGSAQDQNNGKRLVQALNSQNLIVLNEGNPTRVSKPNEKVSAVDLTLATPSLVSKVEWTTYSNSMGSDHIPIFISFNSAFIPQHILPFTKWDTRTANWPLFSRILENKFSNINDEQTNIKFFITALNEASNIALKVNQPLTVKTPKPLWWDTECSQMISKRKSAYHQYKTQSNWENYLNYKQVESKTKLLLKKNAKVVGESF